MSSAFIDPELIKETMNEITKFSGNLSHKRKRQNSSDHIDDSIFERSTMPPALEIPDTETISATITATVSAISARTMDSGSISVVLGSMVPKTTEQIAYSKLIDDLILCSPVHKSVFPKIKPGDSVLDILDSVFIPVGCDVKKLYHNITNHLQGQSAGYWRFYSADHIRHEQYKFNGKFIDIAIKYQTLGKPVMLAYIPSTNRFFFHWNLSLTDKKARSPREAREMEIYNPYVDDDDIPFKFPQEVFVPISDVPIYNKYKKDIQYTYNDVVRRIFLAKPIIDV
jgi:hypothetical protein